MRSVDEMEEALLSKYKELEARGVRPEGAWSIGEEEEKKFVKPAIPFIGKNYVSQKPGCRVLLYASAENLTGYDDYQSLLEECGMKRCRVAFESSCKTDFFPSVHIQPITDGGLLVATYQILKNLLGEQFEEIYGEMSPRDFLECICCANYGKFTFKQGEGERNVDRANSKGADFLEACHEYVKTDVEILEPDIIIIPSGVYYGANQKELFFEKHFSGSGIKVAPIYQINAQVVNCTIKRKYAHLFSEDMLLPNELKWHKGIKRIKRDNFLGVYPYIKNVCLKELKIL